MEGPILDSIITIKSLESVIFDGLTGESTTVNGRMGFNMDMESTLIIKAI